MLDVVVLKDKASLARAAATHAARSLRCRIENRGEVRILVATGESQIGFLERLAEQPGILWSRVELFHLDEYVGLPHDHPASFAQYVRDRLIRPLGIATYHLIDGEANPACQVSELGRVISRAPIDLAFAGIGENGHLAFNDPPADFDTTDPYVVVQLDEACRRQQVGEGWFASIEDVPKRAISISIQQLLRAREIISVVPDERKAAAVKACLEGEISPLYPASILRSHSKATIYLDHGSASALSPAAVLPAKLVEGG